LADLDERMVERYLRHRARSQSIQPGDRAALRRLLLVMRDARTIAPVALPPLTPHEQNQRPCRNPCTLLSRICVN
jgi:hypothetical protein